MGTLSVSKMARARARWAPSRSKAVTRTLLSSVDRLVAQCGVCAAAAQAISQDDGERSRQAAACLPMMLDHVRDQLETLHGSIEFLVRE